MVAVGKREIYGCAIVPPDYLSGIQPSYQDIKIDMANGVGTITIARPKQLNALNSDVMREVTHAASWMDGQRADVRAIIITGEGKSFAAGADVKELADVTYEVAYRRRLLAGWQDLQRLRKPLIAAVDGYALGGGCEVAMLCDIIVASDTATFGQPELALGVIPGMGATQRLTRAVGKAKAMDMILTGARMTAADAERAGLVSRVVPEDQLMPTAVAIAQGIAGKSRLAVAKAKECINRAAEVPLSEGVRFEQREFWSLFGHADQREGMAAFLEKREPQFNVRAEPPVKSRKSSN